MTQNKVATGNLSAYPFHHDEHYTAQYMEQSNQFIKSG